MWIIKSNFDNVGNEETIYKTISQSNLNSINAMKSIKLTALRCELNNKRRKTGEEIQQQQ